TTSYSGSPTLRSSGSTVRSQSARPTARRQDWRHWPRSTNTSRGAKRSPRTSTRRTATSNSLPAFMPTQLATHPTSQNATIRRAKQRDSTSTCNTTDDPRRRHEDDRQLLGDGTRGRDACAPAAAMVELRAPQSDKGGSDGRDQQAGG